MKLALLIIDLYLVRSRYYFQNERWKSSQIRLLYYVYF